MVLDFYPKMKNLLQEEKRLVLMVVIANEGSSPGRKGFKMAVSKNQLLGTIGGGIMEIKLVEYAKSLLAKERFQPFTKRQIHDKSAPADQSGMICSGEQSIAFYDIDDAMIPILDSIISNPAATVYFTDSGIHTELHHPQESAWEYSEPASLPNKVYIVGGGHVGLALCEVLSRLDFEIHVLDHRENLNTMNANTFAHYKETILFEEVGEYVPEGDNVYVVIMSVGYRTDEIIVSRLLDSHFRYIGLMGSKEKIATLKQNLYDQGFTYDQVSKVQMPIGIDIKSESAAEIAISVAAELISVKNKIQ